MRQAPSKTNSQIITAFAEASQQMEILDAVKLSNEMIAKQSKERRKFHESRKKSSKKNDSFNDSLNKAEKFRNMDEHKIDLKELYKRMEVEPDQGLSNQVALLRLKEYGENVLAQKQGRPWYLDLIHELTGFFSLLLWIGSILCLIAYFLDTTDPSNLYLAIVLAIVVTLTAFVTFFQNRKSAAIMESFKNFIPPQCTAFRDGKKVQIDAAKLVPGDIIEVKGGDKIPADFRIIQSQEMKVDHASLTGESDLLIRTPECTNKDNPLETKNLAFFGTLCKEGTAKGIVIKTGQNTVIGQIANLASSASADISPLLQELNRFIVLIAIIAAGLGVVFFVLGILLGYSIINNISFAIGIIVANVPEGLYATITITLALTAKKLAARKVLVKNLEAVETLGSTTCICSDKTGTLTQNRMTVEHLWYDGKKVKGHNKQKHGENFKYEYNINDSGFQLLHSTAMTCSEAVFNGAVPQQRFEILDTITNQAAKDKKRAEIEAEYQQELQNMSWLQRPTIGDASETALIKFFQCIEDILVTRNKNKVVSLNNGTFAKMPFNSTNKYALNICEIKTDDSDYCLFIKGAPEKIWSFCSQIYINNKPQDIDDYWKSEFKKINLSFGKQGERVLGFAKLHLPRSQFPLGYQFKVGSPSEFNFQLQNIGFIGLISMIDPPRDAVPGAVKKCLAAGIKVIMVTGDQPVTATAIARQCNIIKDRTADEIAEEEGISLEAAMKKANAIVIHGDMLTEALREDEGLPENEKGKKLASWLLKPQIVFARTSPAQKLIIVSGCQKLNHVVAVTGDGVNDSPAIKKADIGVSMGITGSDVAKDAADMILLTDDFSAIVIGIEEGRKIFDNIKKSIAYILISNVSEVGPFLVFIILQIPLPLSTVLCLCISIGTDILPCIAYAYEGAELDIMTREPRSKFEHMVNLRIIVYAYLQQGIIENIGAFLTYFVIMQDFGFDPSNLLFIITKTGVAPKQGDVYDSSLYNFGNSNAFCKGKELNTIEPKITDGTAKASNEITPPDWLFVSNKDIDLRMYFLKCGEDGILRQQIEIFADCKVKQISPISHRPVCYSTESVRYAQTGFFFTIVLLQISNALQVKQRKLSLIYQGIKNQFFLFAFTSELLLTLVFAFIIPLNIGLGTRDLTFLHWGTPGLVVAVFLFLYDESKKYFIRNFQKKPEDKFNWFERNCLW